MSADTVEMVVTEPGIYQMNAEVYHADPVPGGSLSSTGARKLLPPSCPARFRWEQDHPPAPKAAFDIGHAAHEMVLGGGPEIVKVDADSWRTNKAKAAAEEARGRGAVPLLPEAWQMVHDMADALRQHPIASALLDPSNGKAEQSLFWTDGASGVNCRARFDLLPNPRKGRLIIPDYKTADSAEPRKWIKAATDHGYHQQHAWYGGGIEAASLAEDWAFVFVVQEKAAPYLISIIELDLTALRIGQILNRRAIDIYAECQRTGRWPGYGDDIEHVALPYYYAREFEDQL